jgi:hypothetical protein
MIDTVGRSSTARIDPVPRRFNRNSAEAARAWIATTRAIPTRQRRAAVMP